MLIVGRIWLLAMLACAAVGQEPETTITPRPKPGTTATAPAPKANIRVDTTVVLVPVNVTDPLNRFVTGLEQQDFRIFEDGVAQKIVSFGNEDAPLSVGIVFDTSGSMGGNLAHSRLSVAEFFKTANPEDEAFLVEFANRPELVVPFTHELGHIQDRLLSTRPKGSTALLDGVTLALQTMKKAANPRKALIVITDGGDNHSRYTFGEVRNRVREADVQIYAIGIFGGMATPEEASGPGLLSALSEPTGGHHFVGSLRELTDIASKIGVELRNQYLIGYSPSNGERDGKYRRITVNVIQPRGLPKIRPHWRTGYFAPTQQSKRDGSTPTSITLILPSMPATSPVRAPDLAAKKQRREKISMIAVYDATMARLFDRAGVDILLVGDSLGMTILGACNTLSVTVDEMVHHTRAVARGAERALVVADMPFLSHRISDADTMRGAGRLLQEGGAAAVKLEGGRSVLASVSRLVEAGVPVMGHLGLTPQSFHQLGGFRVQAKENAAARSLLEDAKGLEQAGAFALVLECIPAALAREVTGALRIPVIGIGAGPDCDGQVLVSYDMLGLFDNPPPFAKQYANLRSMISKAALEFVDDVRAGRFPE